MSALPVNFSGRFQVWSYSVSHGQLLLRSTKSAERPTQIDVLFSNVAAMCLAAAFDGMEIRRAAASDFTPPLQLGALSSSGRETYRILGREVDGYVVAGSVVWDEAAREYDAVSQLLGT